MKYFLFAFLLVSVAQAKECEKVKILCSYNCDDVQVVFKDKKFPWRGRVEVVQLKDYANFMSAMRDIDAFIIPGGEDIEPKFYSQNLDPETLSTIQKFSSYFVASEEGSIRDPIEWELLRVYRSEEEFKKLPMLGLCRGMQMMAASVGLPLYVDLKAELGMTNPIDVENEIILDDPIHLSAFVGPKFRGYEWHHQGVRLDYYEKNLKKFPMLKMSAYSHDKKILEVMEWTDRPALGTQFHPEWSNKAVMFKFYDYFLDRACEYQKVR